MTIQNIKVKLLPKFPANVTAVAPLSLTQSSGAYTFGLDVGAISGPILAEVESVLNITTANNTGIPGSASTQLNADIARVVAAGGGKLYLPAGTYDCSGTQIVVDVSALATRFQGRIILEGDGVATVIRNNVGSCFKFIGSTANPEAYFEMRNIRFKGNNVSFAVGVELSKAAFVTLRDVTIEQFGIGLDATDVDQIGIYDSEIRFNVGGVRINAKATVSDGNSWTFVNSCVGNNSVYGLQITNANAFTYLGGTIQYNGVIGGGAGQYGILMSDTGSGYGTVLFAGMAFEGNGGAGDFLSAQVSAGATHCNVTFDNVSFMRTLNFVTVGYGTNQVAISGSQPDANYKFINCNFYGLSGYVASAGRPAIANTNTNARIEIDGLTKFWSTTEAPATRDRYAGYPGQHTGRIKIGGATSGEGTLTGPAAASNYVWTLPAITGTLLTDGSTKTLTNTTFDSGATGNVLNIAGTNITGVTGGGGLLVMTNNAVLGGTVKIASLAGGTAANSTATIASTTNGAPSGDSVVVIGSAIQLRGNVGVGANLTPDAPLTINSNAAASVAPDPGTVLHLVGADTTTNSIALDAYGSFSTIVGRRANGTQAAKTVTVANNPLIAFQGFGWDGSAYTQGMQFQGTARETWSGTARGASVSIFTTPLTTTAIAEAIRVQPSGGVSVGASAISSDPGIGSLNMTGSSTIASATAVPAGGTAGLGLKMSSTSNLGVFFGSGAPTLSAAQGSLYVRTDGSSTSTRLYVNTNGSTTWTNVTTAT